jgi:hypothetical protein
MSRAETFLDALLAPAAGLQRLERHWASRSPLRAHVFFMSLLFGSALAVGYALLPGDSERIAMLERDGKTREARQILEARYTAGDRRQRTIFQLQGLYESGGNLSKTRETLELLAQQRPRDANVQRQLGLFYKQTQDEPSYIRTLLQQIDVRFSETACREVIGLYRRSGAFAEEQAALQKCRTKGYRRPDDMVRLASLLAADGDIKEASVLLRSVDDLRRLKSDRERLQLFELLLEIEQPGEAQRRAARWVKATKDDKFALTLVSALVAAHRHDLAIELVRETSVPGDSVFLAIAEVMLERGQVAAAQLILRGWFDKAVTLEPPVAARFVTAALAAEVPDLALSGAQKIGLARLPVATAAELARGLEAAGRRGDSESLRAILRQQPEAARLDLEPVTPPQSGPVAPPVRVSSLDGWRSGLWKRLREENKLVALPAAGQKSIKSARDLQALKRARKLSNYRKRFEKTKPAQPSPAPFEFFYLKPGG